MSAGVFTRVRDEHSLLGLQCTQGKPLGYHSFRSWPKAPYRDLTSASAKGPNESLTGLLRAATRMYVSVQKDAYLGQLAREGAGLRKGREKKVVTDSV